jgi:hypothetical protein
MSDSKKVSDLAFIDRSFEPVKALLRSNALDVLKAATLSAAARARDIGATLHIDVGPVDIAVDVRIYLDRIIDEPPVAGLLDITKADFHWEAARNRRFFPLMRAQISVWAISPKETLIAFEGEYVPPLGIAGSAIDAVLGHRVAQATVHRFLEDVVGQIQSRL